MSLRERIYSLETEYAVTFYHTQRDGSTTWEIIKYFQEMLAKEYGSTEHTFLVTGAKFDEDSGHPEWSLPECRTPREVVAYDKAADAILAEVSKQVEQHITRQGYRGALKVF